MLVGISHARPAWHARAAVCRSHVAAAARAGSGHSELEEEGGCEALDSRGAGRVATGGRRGLGPGRQLLLEQGQAAAQGDQFQQE